MADVSSALKLHVLIIPGAWYPVPILEIFIKSLKTAGFSAEAVSLPSLGTAGISVQDDEVQTKAVLTPFIDEGKDIIILSHSYGGLVAAGVVASPNLDKRSREAQGLKGGVVSIVYLSAVVPVQDESILQLVGGKWLEYIDDAKPHSEVALKTAPSAVGWQDKAYDGRRAYIRCLQDNALPITIQDHLVARSEVEWVVKTPDSSHSPFLSMPDELTRVLKEIVEDFAKS